MPSKETPRVKLVYPTENTNPWWDIFETMMTQLDSALYAGREDRNLFISGGGTITWDSSIDNLSWTDSIKVISPVLGGAGLIAASNVTIADGQFLCVTLTRYASTSYTLTTSVTNTVPSDNNVLALVRRDGDTLIWKNGFGPMGGEIELSTDVVDALTVANTPSAGNPFATIADLPVIPPATAIDKTPENLTAQVDGIVAVFTTGVPYVAGTLRVFVDGKHIGFNGVGFTETTPSTGVFTIGVVPLLGSTLIVEYFEA